MCVSAALLFALSLTLEIPLGSAERAELLAACSRALPDETCSLAEVGSTPKSGALRAIVRSSADADAEVTVMLGDQRLSSSLHFADQDEPLERARAIGLAAGVLGGSLRAAKSSESSSPEEQTPEQDSAGLTEEGAVGATPSPSSSDQPTGADAPERSPPPPLERPAPSGPRKRASKTTPPIVRSQFEPIDAFLGFYGGAGFDPGTGLFDFGVTAQGGIRAWKSWVVTAGVHFFSAPQQQLPFRVLRVGPSVGLGYAMQWQGLQWVPVVQAGAEMYGARTFAPPAAEGSHWSPLLRTACLIGYPLSRRLSVQLVPEVDWILSPTTVFVASRPVATGAPLRLTLNVGLSFVSPGSR